MENPFPWNRQSDQRYRVLLVEDDAIIAELTAELLEELNCQVTVVNNGEAAVETAIAGEWEIIFMDVMMRGMNGLEATQKIKNHARFGQLPIVGITGADDELETCLQAGMAEVLVKPVSKNALKQCIEDYCKCQ